MTMDSLPYPILTNVLEVIGATSEYSDGSIIRQKALDMLFRTISAERAVLILPDTTTLPSHVMIKNVDEKFHGYYHTYYHQFDPLQLLKGMDRGDKKGHLELVRTYSYDSQQSTEYYTDFLKPQKIHYKLIANLVAEQEIYGRIVWMRSLKSGQFTGQELWLAKAISPCLAHVLAYNELRERLKLKEKIINYIENQSSVGILLLDEKLQVIYVNQKAEELFDALENPAVGASGKGKMLSKLMKNCREIQTSMKGSPRGCMAIPRKRVISGFNHTNFAVTFKALDHEWGVENSLLFMVCIEELSPPLDVDSQYLSDSYHLSQREIDVASHLFAGLKNAQIADKLFISERTVKTHLQNIYKKVRVNNRTSLINKMLTR